MPRTSYGPDKRSQAWTLLAALLNARGSSGSEQVTVNSVAITYCNWSSIKNPYLDVQATLIDLAGLSGLPGEQVRESLTAHLGKHLGIFEDKRSQKAGCNAENWQFVLRLWSTDLGENQREFEALWQFRKSGGRTQSQPATTEPDSIDALVREVRSRLTPKIKNVVGTLRMLRVSHSVPVDEIYVDLNVLQQVSRDRTFSGHREAYQPGDRRSFARVGLEQVEQERVSALSIVQDYPRLMVLGKPGSGKTTLLKSLAVQYIKEEEPLQWNQQLYVPIFVTLRRFAEAVRKEERLSLLNYIIRQEFGSWGDRGQSVAEAIVHHGRALILLDGLDEVPAAEQSSVVMEIEQFCQFANRVLITCRTQWRQRLEGFTDVEVANFTRVEIENSQVVQFIHSWFRKVVGGEQSADLAEKLIQQIRDNEPIAELTETPVLLNLICSVCRDGKGILPRSRADLYRKGIRDLLTNIDAEKPGLKREPIYAVLTPDKKEDLLTYLAVTLFEANDLFPEQSTLEKLVAEYLHIERCQAEKVLRSLEEQSGLLIERAEGFWSFSHLTFQEYLVAEHFSEYSNWSLLIGRITELRWAQVFQLISELINSSNNLLRAMQEEIEKLSKSEVWLQKILSWLNQKSLSVRMPYKLAAIRAYYLAISFPLVNAILLSWRFNLAPNLGDPENFPIALDHMLSEVLNHAIRYPLTLDLQRILNFPRLSGDRIDEDLNSKLRESLEGLQFSLPSTDSSQELRDEWCNLSRNGWIISLRTSMIEHRNIGYDWDLNESQVAFLQKYYEANLLLIDCLHCSRAVDDEVRQEIEETLLLPIAEINKA